MELQQDALAGLTVRQIACVCALSRHHQDRPRAAAELGITEGTLDQHLKAARAAVNVGSTKQLIALVVGAGRCAAIPNPDSGFSDIAEMPAPVSSIDPASERSFDGKPNDLSIIQRLLTVLLLASVAALLLVPLLGGLDGGIARIADLIRLVRTGFRH